MKHILILFLLSIVTLSAFGQAGSQSISVLRSRVNDSTTVNGAHASGYGDIYFNNQRAQPAWLWWDAQSGTYKKLGSFAGGWKTAGTTTLTATAQINIFDQLTFSSTQADIDIGSTPNGVLISANVFKAGSQGDGAYFQASGTSSADILITANDDIQIAAGTTGGNHDVTIAATDGIINLNSDFLHINGSAGTAGNVLTSNGAAAAPTWQAPSGGAAAIAYTDIAYVDVSGNNGTAVLGRIDKPYATIDGALDANIAVVNLKIKVGMGTYASPTPAKVRSHLWLEGSGKPGYNWSISETAYAAITITDPTALKGGTILQGTLECRDVDNVHISDLGVDVGSAYVTGGGTEANGIAFLSSTVSAPFALMENIVIENVTTLGRTAGSLFHGILVENCYKPIVQNADTYFSTHGIAFKNLGGIINNVRCHNHTSDGIIIKTDSYAFGFISMVSNFEIQGGGGLIVNLGSTSGGMATKVANGTVRSTTFGVRVFSTITTPTNYVDISGVKVYGCSGIGFDIADGQSIMISDCMALGCTSQGFKIVATATETFAHIFNCLSESNSVGFDIAASSSTSFIRNCAARNNTGAGYAFGANVRSSGLSVDGNGSASSGSTANYELGSWYLGGTNIPTARLQIAAGTATASTAPLKLTSGTNLTTPEAGAIEFDGTNYFATTSTTRHTIAKTLTATGALNFDLTAVNSQDLTITVTGAADGDAVSIGVPNVSATANVIYTAWTSGANTVTIRASRIDVASGADPASGTFRAAVIKY